VCAVKSQNFVSFVIVCYNFLTYGG
jgi:hypothetical protein